MHDTITKLRNLANEVRAYQLERGWSDARLCKEIASVGSSKTYKRALDADDELEDLNLENQLRNFQSAVEIIAGLRQNDRPAELEYADFYNLQKSEIAVRRASLEDEECVARLVIIEGNTATGKDAVKRHLLKKFPNNCVALEATELWRMSPTTPLLAIHQALAVVKQKDKETGELPKPPRYPRELLAEIVAALKERKQIVLINEAHHMGVPGLNIVKSIINMTSATVVLICIPALLTRLLGGSYEEAIQLTGNRLCERVYLPSPISDEILMMLDRRDVKFDNVETRNTAGKTISAEAPTYGNWRFVSQVTRKLYAATKRAPVNLAALAKAVAEVKAMRTRIVKQPQVQEA